MVSPWKVILATMIIFGCGAVMGGLLVKTALPAASDASSHPVSVVEQPPLAQIQRPEFARRMQKQLDLTPEQRDQIAKIISDSQERSRRLWATIAPELRDELRQVRQQIRQTLNGDQKAQFDELLHARSRKGETAGPAVSRRPALRPPAADPTNSP